MKKCEKTYRPSSPGTPRGQAKRLALCHPASEVEWAVWPSAVPSLPPHPLPSAAPAARVPSPRPQPMTSGMSGRATAVMSAVTVHGLLETIKTTEHIHRIKAIWSEFSDEAKAEEEHARKGKDEIWRGQAALRTSVSLKDGQRGEIIALLTSVSVRIPGTLTRQSESSQCIHPIIQSERRKCETSCTSFKVYFYG